MNLIRTAESPTTILYLTKSEPCADYKGKTICTGDLLEIFSQNDENSERALIVEDDLLSNFRSNEVMPSPADEGCCSAANPYVPRNVAPIVLVFDIFLPGTGTIIAAYFDPSGCNCKTVTCGIFQMLLTVVLVGWIWSIIQGVAIYKKSIQYYKSQ